MRSYAKVFSILGMFVVACILLADSTSAMAAAPVITKISPNNGAVAGGTSVAISGTGFVSVSSVKFGGAASPSVTVNSSTSITAVSPSGNGLVDITVTTLEGTSAVTPYDQFGYDTSSGDAWLGLNGNSDGAWSGGLGDFVAHNITYDRGGGPGIEWTAGELAEESGKITARGEAIAKSLNAGMVPDIVIEYAAYNGSFKEDPNFPTEEKGSNSLKEYVEGFVSSASSILKAFPGRHILFEPMNEPWGYTTPQYNSAQYANVLAKLLPAAKESHIPLEFVYAAAFGANCLKREAKECTTNGWVPALYSTQPKLRTEVQGWYFHPYGPPAGTEFYDSWGIQSLPLVQTTMTSGQNNIIVSEVGYCVLAINSECNSPYVSTQTEGEKKLTEMLYNALPYHEAGWLKALIVYARSDGGWAMQQVGAKLTNEGEALDRFGDFFGLGWVIQPSPNQTETEHRISNFLTAMSCTSAELCTAVGATHLIAGCCQAQRSPLVERWNGTEWVLQSISKAGAMNGVACPTTTMCIAVGTTSPSPKFVYTSAAEIWKGSEWTLQSTPEVSGQDANLKAVACPVYSECIAVGNYTNSEGTLVALAERWTESGWVTQTILSQAGAKQTILSGISCSSATMCTATGNYVNGAGASQPFAERWNGAAWSIQAVPLPSGATGGMLDAVVCVGSNECRSVGNYTSSGGVVLALAERWTEAGWVTQTIPSQPSATQTVLSGISCSSATACTATGHYVNSLGGEEPIVERENGVEWSLQNIPTSSSEGSLPAVSCAAATACIAVGSASTTNILQLATLVERYG